MLHVHKKLTASGG